MNDQKALKIFGPGTWCTQKPFSYRVAQHRYFLTSYPGQINDSLCFKDVVINFYDNDACFVFKVKNQVIKKNY